MDIPAAPFEHVSVKDKMLDVMEHPAFDGKADMMFPWDDRRHYHDGLVMDDLVLLHMGPSYKSTQRMVDGVNRLIDDRNRGWQIFYDIYSDEEKKADSTKERTGMFYLRGTPRCAVRGVLPRRRILLSEHDARRFYDRQSPEWERL